MKVKNINRRMVQLGFLLLFIIIGRTSTPQIAKVVIVLTILAGAVFCGWMCPFGLIQDVMRDLRVLLNIKAVKIPTKYHKVFKNLRYIIYGISFLSIGSILIKLSIYDPFSNVTQLISRNMIALISVISLVFFSILSLFIDRFFCKYLCMEGAKYSILSFGRILSIERKSSCVNCKKCEKACPVALEITSKTIVNDIECIRCKECVNACPIENTLSLRRYIDIKRTLIVVPIVFIILRTSVSAGVVNESANLEDYPIGTVITKGSAEGYKSDITLDVVSYENEIIDIVVTKHNDTSRYFDSASTVIDDIINEQSIEVDTITGATISSLGIINAVESTLNTQ